MSARVSLALFLTLPVLGGLAIGMSNPPDAWYAALNKPAFNPPNWLFGPVWTALYVMIGVAGWRSWRQGAHHPGMKLWWLQMVLNFAWSPLFFGAHRMDIALVVILGLLLAINAFIVSQWRREPLAARLFIPYSLWVGFATVLNTALLTLN